MNRVDWSRDIRKMVWDDEKVGHEWSPPLKDDILCT